MGLHVSWVTWTKLLLCHLLLVACLKISFLWEVLKTQSHSILSSMGHPNPGVVGVSPHDTLIQVDTGCQVTLVSGVGKESALDGELFLCSYLFSAACMAADVPCCSCFNEFLHYLHSSDLFENSSSPRLKNPPQSKLSFFLVLHLVSRERPP